MQKRTSIFKKLHITTKYLVAFIVVCNTFKVSSQTNRGSTLIAEKINPYQYKQTKSNTFYKGAVVTAHPLASLVGSQILQKGGNAFDAAIATQLALAVVYPAAGNIGGGGFLLAKQANGKMIALDYRETAPALAHRNMYLDVNGIAQTQLAQNGHLAVGIPGTIAGLFATLPYAKLQFNQLIQPAIDLAELGFCITAREADNLNNNQQAFIQYNTQPNAFINKNRWKAGDTLIQKDLANTLIRIRDNGWKGFYEGKTAQLILEEMKRGNGIISLEDLKSYSAKLRQPIHFSYKGFDIVGFPPPSSGGILLLQMLKMIEPFNITAKGFQTPETVQLMVEAERRAYADRAKHLGDADFYAVPIQKLTDSVYLRHRMKDFVPNKAGNSQQTKAATLESEETTHISIYDKWGNMVSITTTLNGNYGSKTVVGGAGFLLNNEMDDFSIKPGVANMYGAVGGEANAIQPKKRMLSSMCPVLVTQKGKPIIIAGTPGGTTIPTSIFQTLVNMIDFNMHASDAVNKPKFHHQHLPDVVFVEKTFPSEVRIALEKMGYTITERSPIGRTEVIQVKGKKIIAVADTRGDDSVAGY